MTAEKKLSLINEMIGNYYEFCSFDDEGMNAGSLQMLIGCIEAVLAHEDKDEPNRHPEDAECDGDCMTCPEACADDSAEPWYGFCSDEECETCDYYAECLEDELMDTIQHARELLSEYTMLCGDED